jgi:iron complex outermembrane receptor protein
MKSIKLFVLILLSIYLSSYILNAQNHSDSISYISGSYHIGYDTIQAEYSTYSLEKVQNKDFNKGFMVSPEQLIQGKVAGVQVSSSSGEPGSVAQINIRGYSSFMLNNNPLIIVDGFPLSEFDNSPAGFDLSLGNSAAKNPLNFLNPATIKSIEVIKDISATAIYGARGANGVIIITTKSGEQAEGRFEFDASVGISRATKSYNLLNGGDYLANLSDYGANPDDLDKGENTDWQEEVSNQKISYQYNLAYSNSYKNGNYRASFGLENQEGVIRNSSLNRPNISFNINHSMLEDKLKVSFRLNGSQVQQESPFLSNNSAGLLGAVYTANPTSSADPENQEPGFLNPSSLLNYYSDETKTLRGIAYLSLDYEIVPSLNFVVNNGYDVSLSDRNQAFTSELQSPSIFGNGRAVQQEMNSKSYLLEAMLRFKKNLGAHHINLMGGFAYQNFNVAHTSLQGFGFRGENNFNAMQNNLTNSASSVRNSINGSYQQWGIDPNQFFVNKISPVISTETNVNNFTDLGVDAMVENTTSQLNEFQSFFGRFNYDYANKYFVSAVLRVDGSTRFAPNNKYGVFPGISAAWLLSNEDFVPNTISHLKLRAGFGIAGNHALPHNAYANRQAYSQPFINFDGQIFTPGLVNISFENPDLKWEQTQEITMGLDFGFWSDRLLGTFNFYNRNTSDLVFSQANFGGATAVVNLPAEISNKGLELKIDYNLLNSTNFNWDLGFNIATNKNEVQNYGGIIAGGAIYGQGLQGVLVQRISEGQPLFAYYLSDFTGFDADGISEFKEGGALQNTGKSPNPKYNLGFYSAWGYRNFDLNVQFSGQLGHYLYNNTAHAFFTAGSYGKGRNVTEEVLNSGESAFNAPDASTRFLEKGDFLRLQNLVVGYSFKMEKSKAFSSIKVTAIGQNLFTFTKYSGIDPEVFNSQQSSNLGGLGIDYLAYPRAKTYSLGVNLVF